jgi:predicted nucleic acid-binding protein
VILADTSVWVEHLRRGSPALRGALEDGLVVCHPFIVGELALGALRQRAPILDLLTALETLPVSPHDDVLALVERRALAGRGIGWVDAHLLASALIARTPLWTLDRRLAAVASDLDAAWRPG